MGKRVKGEMSFAFDVETAYRLARDEFFLADYRKHPSSLVCDVWPLLHRLPCYGIYLLFLNLLCPATDESAFWKTKLVKSLGERVERLSRGFARLAIPSP